MTDVPSEKGHEAATKDAYAAAERLISEASKNEKRELDLSDLRALDAIPPLDDHSQLKIINLRGTLISDLKPLSGLLNLERVILWDTPVSDISPLAGLPNLNYVDLDGTRIDDISALSRFPSLRLLYLKGTRVADLTPLAKLTGLMVLDFSDTEVSDPSPLSNLTSLWLLDIANTKVTDISNLAGLTRILSLSLSNTGISDLSPIANMTRFATETGNRLHTYGISYDGCPLADSYLLELAKEPNLEKRTRETIRYVREAARLPPIEVPAETTEAFDAEKFTTLRKQLDQNPLGATFEAIDTHLVIAPSGHDTDQQAANDPVTQQLHAVVRRRAEQLASNAIRLANQPGWQALSAASEHFRVLVALDPKDFATNIGIAWAELVSLGSFVEQDNELQRKPESFVAPLEPDMRRALVDLIQAGAPWIRRFPSARAMDEEHAAFHAQLDRVPAARDVIAAAKAQDVVSSSDSMLVEQALLAGGHVGRQSEKAGSYGILSTRNLAFGAIALVATSIASGFSKEVGRVVATQSVLAPKIERFVLDGEEALLRFLNDLPSDIRSLVKALIDELKMRAR